jgi:hypothetical protein
MSEESFMRFEFQVDLKAIRHRAARKKSQPRQSKLFQSLLLAHQLQQLFQTGKVESFQQACVWLSISPARLSQILTLQTLSPWIQEQILFANLAQAEPENKAREIALKTDWEEQRHEWSTLLSKTRKEGNHADIENE